MTIYRMSPMYREAKLRAERQRAAMNHRRQVLQNVGKRALTLRSYVHHEVQS